MSDSGVGVAVARPTWVLHRIIRNRHIIWTGGSHLITDLTHRDKDGQVVDRKALWQVCVITVATVYRKCRRTTMSCLLKSEQLVPYTTIVRISLAQLENIWTFCFMSINICRPCAWIEENVRVQITMLLARSLHFGQSSPWEHNAELAVSCSGRSIQILPVKYCNIEIHLYK